MTAFMNSLSKDVKVIKELPHKGGKVWVPYNMRVPRKCNERCYQIRVLPVLLKKHAVQLSKFDHRLSNKLETDLQKLRCRVNYHALKFTDPINKMGQKLVNRMRKMGKHYVALHLRYALHFSNNCGAIFIFISISCLANLSMSRDNWEHMFLSSPE
ncbi:GDP-fucose protein O-fucosyltransferase [Tanacetum coccineum]